MWNYLNRAFLAAFSARGRVLVYGGILIGAILDGADLSKADLTGANVSPEQLARASNLEGATMPNGSKYGAPPEGTG